MFCCGLCTYKATTKAHLGVHAYFTHDAKPVSWYKDNSNDAPDLLSDEFKTLSQRKRYFCALTSTCQFSCLTNELFRMHLETHEDCGAYICHLCFGSAVTCGRLLHHYQIDHEFFAVHCLNCDFGSNDDWAVMRHVMEKHSRRPFRMLHRNGDAAAVAKELRLLMQEYLTSDPVNPAQPYVQLSLEPLTQAKATSCDKAMPEVGPMALGHSSLKVKLRLDPHVDKNFAENHVANSDAYVTHESAGRLSPLSTEESLYSSPNESSQHFAMQPVATESLHPSAHQDEEYLAMECNNAQPLHQTEITSSLAQADSWHVACNAENCSMEFRDIFDYLNHLTECHPLQSSFLCPMCSLTVSSVDFSVHLVEKHSGLLFCPYQGCPFGSRDQSGLDNHIVQAHQIYHDNISLVASECESSSTTSTAFSKNRENTGSVDSSSATEICSGEGRDDKFHCELNFNHTKDDPAIQLYSCNMCSRHYNTLSHYIYHITSEHSMPFVCGHCFKPYKKSRSLLVHSGCLHLGQPFSVFSLSDEKVIDVGPKVAPLWIKEAEQYLRTVHPRRMKATGKTMLKNLKRALDYIRSACSGNMSPQTEPCQSSSVPHGAYENLKLACEAQRMPLQYDHAIGTVCSEDEVFNGGSAPSQLDDSTPPRSFCNGSSNYSSEKRLNQFEVPDKFKDFGTNLDTPTLLSQNTPSSRSQHSIARRAELKILASVYLDPSSYKKVNDRVVVDSDVLRRLLRLNSEQSPMSSPHAELSGSLYSRVSEGFHACSECYLTFSTFPALAKHIVSIHNLDFINCFDLARAVLSFKDNWELLQGSTSKFHVKQPRSTAQLRFTRMQSRGQKMAVDNRTLVCLHSTGTKVPYSEYSRSENLDPVVKLFRLPMIKNEPKE